MMDILIIATFRNLILNPTATAVKILPSIHCKIHEDLLGLATTDKSQPNSH